MLDGLNGDGLNLAVISQLTLFYQFKVIVNIIFNNHIINRYVVNDHVVSGHVINRHVINRHGGTVPLVK